MYKYEMKDMYKTKISFNTTVYNSMPWVKRSLLSLIYTCRILKNVHDVNCEIVVIDNYSDDGTYEDILKMKHEIEDIPIKVTRHRCKRGLGRHLALLLSKGSHVIYVDMDTIYNSKLLADLIAKYLSNPLLFTRALYIFLVPRILALKVGSIQDLNRTEDVEFCARLAKEKIVLPLIDPAILSLFKLPLEKHHGREHQYRNPSTRMFIQTYSSERRYSKTLLEYIKREFNNKIDMTCGLGLTPAKIVRESWFLRKMRGIDFLIRVFYHLIFWFITVLIRRKIYSHSKYLSNGVLCDYVMFVNYMELLKKATKLGLVDSDEKIRYIQEALTNKRIRNRLLYARSLCAPSE